MVFRDDMRGRFVRNAVRFKKQADPDELETNSTQAQPHSRRNKEIEHSEDHAMDVDGIEGSSEVPDDDAVSAMPAPPIVSEDVLLARKVLILLTS